MKTVLLALFWGAILIAVAVWTVSGFNGSGITMHGWIALTLGTVLSLAIGGGLMALVFYSARHGYDERIPLDDPDDDEPHDGIDPR